MSKHRKSVLTKGIQHLNLQHGKTEDDRSEEDSKLRLAEEAPKTELKAVYADPEQAVLELAKQFAISGITSTQAVYKALDVVESLVSDARSKFTNLYSPGTVTAIISALDRSRLTGWHNQNAVEHVGPGYVSGGKDKPTTFPNNQGNPSTPGDGFVIGIGRERYGTRAAGGSGEDASEGRAPTGSTRYTGLGQRGGQQPNNVTVKPGRSGNYGHGSEVISTVGPDGKVMVKYHDHPSYRPSANPARMKTPFFAKLGKTTARNEDIQDLTITNSEYSEEELAEALKIRDEELKRRAREEDEDETSLKARDLIRTDLQKRLWARRLLQK